MSRPRIAISSWLRLLPTRLGERTPLYALDPAYAAYVAAAGGDPFILSRDTSPEDALREFDGLILSGGGDIAPATYGAADSGICEDVDPAADQWELSLAAEARRLALPTLGICRGMQLLAIAHGGRLAQEVVTPSLHPGLGALKPDAALSRRHEVELEPGTIIAGLFGASRLQVNTLHHQVVSSPGVLRVTARAADGAIEALESVEWPAIGVQWHPEKMREPEQQRLLAFVLTGQNRLRYPATATPRPLPLAS